jgi:hypothetical protein
MKMMSTAMFSCSLAPKTSCRPFTGILHRVIAPRHRRRRPEDRPPLPVENRRPFRARRESLRARSGPLLLEGCDARERGHRLRTHGRAATLGPQTSRAARSSGFLSGATTTRVIVFSTNTLTRIYVAYPMGSRKRTVWPCRFRSVQRLPRGLRDPHLSTVPTRSSFNRFQELDLPGEAPATACLVRNGVLE